jgi:demethylmenaquinone methyltransferase/2-methoxy-6-polyprenyl-1,4-benzoquinol methylase
MDKNSIVTAYRKYADNYDLAVKLYRLLGLRIGKYRKLTVDSLELSKGDFVVELGCGTGLNFPPVLDAIGPNGKLIGVDITDKMLDQARNRVEENGWKNVELIQSDIADYKFPSKLDGIFATGAIQYSLQYDNIIQRGYEALKTGKNFVIFDFKMPQGLSRIFAPVYKEKLGNQLRNILRKLRFKKVGADLYTFQLEKNNNFLILPKK